MSFPRQVIGFAHQQDSPWIDPNIEQPPPPYRPRSPWTYPTIPHVYYPSGDPFFNYPTPPPLPFASAVDYTINPPLFFARAESMHRSATVVCDQTAEQHRFLLSTLNRPTITPHSPSTSPGMTVVNMIDTSNNLEEQAFQTSFLRNSNHANGTQINPLELSRVPDVVGGVTPFISKLFHALSCPKEYDDVISFSQSGTVVLVALKNPRLLSVLEHLFAHTSVAAFNHQINLYSFNRVSTAMSRPAFPSQSRFSRSTPLTAWTAFELKGFSRGIEQNGLRALRPRVSHARKLRVEHRSRYRDDDEDDSWVDTD